MKFRPLNNDQELLWEAYLDKSFKMPDGLSKIAFLSIFDKILRSKSEWIIIENKRPIALIGASFDGWRYEPHVEFFAWATNREILTSLCEYLSKLSKLDTVGVAVVRALPSSKNLFDHVCKRGLLKYIGCMPKGDYRGHEHIYAVEGLADKPQSTRTPTIGRL